MRRVGLSISLLLSLAVVGCGNVDTTPEPVTAPVVADDADADGFADADDHLPCAGVRLLVANQGVNGVRIALDGVPVVYPDAFPTTDVIEVFLNVVPGANTIELLGGAPDHEELHLIVEHDDKVTRFLDETITRDAGTPPEIALGFTVDATCAQ